MFNHDAWFSVQSRRVGLVSVPVFLISFAPALYFGFVIPHKAVVAKKLPAGAVIVMRMLFGFGVAGCVGTLAQTFEIAGGLFATFPAIGFLSIVSVWFYNYPKEAHNDNDGDGGDDDEAGVGLMEKSHASSGVTMHDVEHVHNSDSANTDTTTDAVLPTTTTAAATTKITETAVVESRFHAQNHDSDLIALGMIHPLLVMNFGSLTMWLFIAILVDLFQVPFYFAIPSAFCMTVVVVVSLFLATRWRNAKIK